MDNWQIVAVDMYLVDIGSPGYTSYEVDRGGFKAADITELYDSFPGLVTGELKNHHIHTHHSMGAFMSTTDWEQMNDRGQLANYFLMLVVDTKPPYDWKATVGFRSVIHQPIKKIAEQKTIQLFHNGDGFPDIVLDGNEENLSIDKEVMCIMECDIEREAMDEHPLDPFRQRFQKIVEAVRTPVHTHTPNPYTGPRGSTYYASGGLGNSGSQQALPGIIPESTEEKGTTVPVGSETGSAIPSTGGGTSQIGAMTEAEWRKWNTTADAIDNDRTTIVLDYRDVRAVFNAMLSYHLVTVGSPVYTDPMPDLSRLQAEGGTRRKEFIENFCVAVRDWLGEHYDTHNDYDHLAFLNLIITWMKPYYFNPLFREIIMLINDDMVDIRQDIAWVQSPESQIS